MLNALPLADSDEGSALTTPALVSAMMSWGPESAVNALNGWSAPPLTAASAPEKLTVPKFESSAIRQLKTPQISGDSAISSADDWASPEPVCVVVKVQPSDDVILSVNVLPLTDTSALSVSPGLTGYCVVDRSTESAGYISYQA